MEVPRGSACLLIGANGTGKSTYMRVLAGKHLHEDSIRGTVALVHLWHWTHRVVYLSVCVCMTVSAALSVLFFW